MAALGDAESNGVRATTKGKKNMELVASNRLYLGAREPHTVLEVLAISAHVLAQAEAIQAGVPHHRMTVTKARRFISRGWDGLRLDMPNLDDIKCRLLVTPSISGSKVLVIDRDLYRGDIPTLVTKAIQTLPEILRKYKPAFF